MIATRLKSRDPRTRFQASAFSPRPSGASRSWASTTLADSAYLTRWVAHQATTYTNLLDAIAAAPAPHEKRG